MSLPIRTLVLTAMLVGSLGACDRDERRPLPPAKSDTAATVTPADAAAPLTYESDTPHASVELTLPEAIKTQPDLHQMLYTTAVRDLTQFTEGAQADRTEAGGDGGMAPYDKSIAFTPAAETARLYSLTRVDSEYTGGAHPISAFRSVLWDKTDKRAVAPTALFRQGADMAVLDTALCAAVNAAKRERGAEPVTATGADWSCPRAAETPYVLAPGATGKAAGLTFLIGPYLVGPYAEGTYEVEVPVAAFRALLAPTYAGEFG